MAGAANTTTGNIAIQATSQDNNQWPTNSIGVGEGKLAIPAAIKLVSPAWRTPKMKWLYLRGMPNMGEAALCERFAALNLSSRARGRDHAFGRQGDSDRLRDNMGRLRTLRRHSQYDLASYGLAFLQLWASIYPGYHPGTGVGSVVIGALYALVDGLIGGAIFGWLYNLIVGE